MNSRFCTTCHEEKDITNSVKGENGVAHTLSCGHRFIELNLSDSIKVSEEIQLKKIGETNEKYRRGDKPPNTNYAQKFIDYGDIDYEAAVLLFNIQNRNYDFMNQAAFLSAQAVEKYLKAFLFWSSPHHYPNFSGKQVLNEFKNLKHDLVKVLDECAKDNKDFNNFRKQIQGINKYSLLKYPDIEDEMVYSTDGLSITSAMSKDVKQIGEFIKKLVSKEE